MKKLILFISMFLLLGLVISSNVGGWQAWSADADGHDFITQKGYLKATSKHSATGCYSYVFDTFQPSCQIAVFMPMYLFFYASYLNALWAAIIGNPNAPVNTALSIIFKTLAYIILERVTRLERWVLFGHAAVADLTFGNSETTKKILAAFTLTTCHLAGAAVTIYLEETDSWRDQFHCDNSDGATNRALMEGLEDKIIVMSFLGLIPIVNDFTFLLHLHQAQDFYAHTYYPYAVTNLKNSGFTGPDPIQSFHDFSREADGDPDFDTLYSTDGNFVGNKKAYLYPDVTGGSFSPPDSSNAPVDVRDNAVDMAIDASSNVLYWVYAPCYPAVALD